MDRRLPALLALLFVASLCAGCRTLPVPEIDETGENFFKPGTQTTLDYNFNLPEPAFGAPPTPPPCPELITPAGTGAAPVATVVPGTVPPGPIVPGPTPLGTSTILTPQFDPAPQPGVQANPLLPGRTGRVTLMPGRIVAPVGSEVLVVANAIDNLGTPLGGENIDWTLATGSVGTITQVAQTRNSFWDKLTHQPDPTLLSTTYALGRTSRSGEVVDRGTPDPSDDVNVLPGQTWISLHSTVEGTTTVNAGAGGMQGWDQQQAVSTIHWIDAQWTFPSPAIVPASQPHRLTTVVSRQTTSQPLAGWIVRYELAGGAPSQLGSTTATGQTAVEVLTDASGLASVEISPVVAEPGVAQVRVQVIRPAMQAGDPERFTAGEGLVSVTFSAPALNVQATGPNQVERGQVGTYRFEVRNPGDLPATNVNVLMEMPTGMTLSGSNPQANLVGNRLQWNLGDLAPKSVNAIELQATAHTPGVARWCARAEAGDGITAEGCVESNIFQRTLTVNMMGPESAEVGEEVQFRIEINNAGQEPLLGVTVTDHFDRGLTHSEVTSPIRRRFEAIEPGQTQRLAITFEVTAPGQLCHQLEVVADDGQRAGAQACVVATRPVVPPSVSVRGSGPDQSQRGEQAVFRFVVTNDGGAPLTNVRLGLRPSAPLVATLASPLHAWNEGEASWVIARLAPGEAVEREIQCRCDQLAEQACVLGTVATAEGVTAESSTCLRIVAAQVEPGGTDLTPPEGNDPEPVEPETPPVVPPADTPPAIDPTAGELTISIVETGDPVRVGGTTTYLVTLKNDRQVSDREVVLTLVLSPGFEVDRLINAPTGIGGTSRDGRTNTLLPISEVRAGETITFRVVAKAIAAGQGSLRIEATSLRTTDAVSDTEATTILAP